MGVSMENDNHYIANIKGKKIQIDSLILILKSLNGHNSPLPQTTHASSQYFNIT